MKNEKDIINTDFQGWPVYKMNLREILLSLGATEKDGILGFETNNPILDIYPQTLEDDGMGYGVNEMYFTETSTGDDFIYMFREQEKE